MPKETITQQQHPYRLRQRVASSFVTNAGPTTYRWTRCVCDVEFCSPDRRGAKALDRALDDLAGHCLTTHEHPMLPVYEFRWGRTQVDDRHRRSWWRGYLAGLLAPQEVEQPRMLNVGGPSNRLKRCWLDGYKAARAEAEDAA